MADHSPLDSAVGAPRPGDGAVPSPAVRSGFALALGLLAAILFVSARGEPVAEHDRIGARVELAELIRAEQARVDELKERVEDLAAQVAAFEQAGPAGGEKEALQASIDDMAAAAGLTPVRGPGVAVILNDSALDPSRGADPNDLIIHEQDLHAVINALWAGGAEAMSVNGQRVLATTAVRCVGSVLLLHGRTYSPPYVIRAIGDEQTLRDALSRDPAVQRFAAAAKAYQLGFMVSVADALELDPYEGTAALQVARPSGDV
ncbi:MAG TPA: DUF881 domain-containing protein [Egibacteraceae bacterium]|jgi:uncharacterized protein YlxW (UPF0749 family)|nr:DUF881 domain-containing protein [Egibacteraceae bacterium]